MTEEPDDRIGHVRICGGDGSVMAVSTRTARKVTDASMRRHENRRGAKVTGDADPEGVEPRKLRWRVPTGLAPRQATMHVASWSVAWILPGVRGRVEPDIESKWKPGRSVHRSAGGGHWRTSVKSEDVGGGVRKSEPSIVAMKLGNSGGAKGWRF